MLSTFSRNTLIASTLLVGASLLVGPAAMAANDPVSVDDGDTVSATVELINVVTFTPEPAPTTLKPEEALSNVSLSLGSVTLRNNSAGGWELKVASANNGTLNSAVGGTTYELPYGAITLAAATGVTPSTPVAATTAGAVLATGVFSTAVAGGTDPIAVTATITSAATTVPAGSYTDTLTFTLTAK